MLTGFVMIQPEIRAVSGKPDFCHLLMGTPATGHPYPQKTDAVNEFWEEPPNASYTWTAQATLLAGPKNGTLNTLVASHTASFAPLP